MFRSSHTRWSMLLLLVSGCFYNNDFDRFKNGADAAASGGAGGAGGSGGHDGGADANSDGPAANCLPQGTWTAPSVIQNVNSSQADLDPSISADGLSLYFASFSAGGQNLGEIYVSTRNSTTAAFGAPMPVTTVNTNQNELGPWISASNLELYFTRASVGIMVTTRPTAAAAWTTPVMVVPNTSDGGVTNASLTADGLTMYFTGACPTIYANGPCTKRVTRPAIGQPWGTPDVVRLPGDLQYSYVRISGDELRMLVSGRFTSGEAAVMQMCRASTTDMWMPLQVLRPIADDGTVTGAAWNHNQTEIYLASEATIGTMKDLFVSALQ